MAAMTEPSAVSTNAPPVAPASDLPPPAFPSALAAALLSAPPPPNMIATRLDFFSTPLPEYAGLYAAVIDSALTAAECAALVSLAESTTDPPATWEQALVNVGGGRQTLLTDVRRCGRIIWDSRAVAAALWARVEGLVGAGVAQARTALDAPGGDAGGLGIARVRGEPRVTGRGPVERGETWRMTRLNERLRFLRYEEGDYFRPHCDGMYETPDGRERSYFTLHLYLSGTTTEDESSGPQSATSPPASLGGATSFFGWRNAPSDDETHRIDVEPKVGRILIFQHRSLLHSGAPVKGGVKLTMRTDVMYELEGSERGGGKEKVAEGRE